MTLPLAIVTSTCIGPQLAAWATVPVKVPVLPVVLAVAPATGVTVELVLAGACAGAELNEPVPGTRVPDWFCSVITPEFELVLVPVLAPVVEELVPPAFEPTEVPLPVLDDSDS